MILYKVFFGNGELTVKEFEVTRQTPSFYVIKFKRSEKRVSKTAQKLFAGTTEKQAYELFKYKILAIEETRRFKPWLFKDFKVREALLQAEKAILNLKDQVMINTFITIKLDTLILSRLHNYTTLKLFNSSA